MASEGNELSVLHSIKKLRCFDFVYRLYSKASADRTTKETLLLMTSHCKRRKAVALFSQRALRHGDATLNRTRAIGDKQQTTLLIGRDIEAELAQLELGLIMITHWEIVSNIIITLIS